MFQRYLWFVVPVAAVILSVSLATPVLAQQAAPQPHEGRVGILDIGAVQRTAKVAQDMEQQIREKRVKFSDEVKKLEDGIRSAAEELERQRVILSPDAYRKQQDELRQKSINDQRIVQERQNQINAMRTEATKEFERVLQKALVEFARENDFMMIFERRGIAFFEGWLDVTAKVVERMDKIEPAHKLSDASSSGKK